MIIQIAAGTGSGPTKMAAFDAALNDAGVANYNLIKLSSIVPSGAKMVVNDGPIKTPPGKWGDKLFVVMSDMRVDTPNVEAWAGIGWVQERKTGRGLFVEHEGANEKSVRRDIEDSLKAMMALRKTVEFGAIHMKVTGELCVHEPVCALAIAVFQATGWKLKLSPLR